MVALAAARIARAISVDEVSAGVRGRISALAERPSAGTRWHTLDRLVGCPLCVGWWASLAVSLVTPGRHRLLRGVAAAGVQVLLALAERWVSEQGRTAIHVANSAERTDADESQEPAPAGGRTRPTAS